MFLSFSCRHRQQNRTVYIYSQNGKYIFYRNGKPFFVKGASGFTHLKEIEEAGGNTIRVWDTVNIAKILDSADKYHLAVIVGIPMPQNRSMNEFYSKDAQVNAQFARITATVKRYKDHPALFCWCIGNELEFPYRLNYNAFYRHFNRIVDMIHREDPNHPVTTTVINFSQKKVLAIKMRTPIDFVSFNIFDPIKTLRKDIRNFNWAWKEPYLVTEWGIAGPWSMSEQNSWGAFIESSSTKKAEQFLEIYQKYMPLDDPRFLGSLAFYWGQKQECTPTWYSFFDEQGARSECINALKYVWTGQNSNIHAPKLEYMLLNNRNSKDNILLPPNTAATGRIYLNDPDTTQFTYKWVLLPEDWYEINGDYRQKKPKPIADAIANGQGPAVKLKTPATEGPYRLFVYVYNKHRFFATCNTPFYVVNNP